MRRPKRRARKNVAIDTQLLDLFRAAMDAEMKSYANRGGHRLSQAEWREISETIYAFDKAYGLETWELSAICPPPITSHPDLHEKLIAMGTPAERKRWLAFYRKRDRDQQRADEEWEKQEAERKRIMRTGKQESVAWKWETPAAASQVRDRGDIDCLGALLGGLSIGTLGRPYRTVTSRSERTGSPHCRGHEPSCDPIKATRMPSNCRTSWLSYGFVLQKEGTTNMTKFSWVLLTLIAIGFAGGIANTAQAGPQGAQGQQGEGSSGQEGQGTGQGNQGDEQ